MTTNDPGGDEAASMRAEEPVGWAPSTKLSRARILDEAIAMIDEDGANAVTMRRLGARLGVEAMALYRYVNGREDLLEGVVDRLVATLQIDPGSQMRPADGWQAFLQWMAHSVRALALQHPNVFPLIATRHPAAPWLRPPLRSLRVVEEFLNGLMSRGFSERQAVSAYRIFTSFLIGHLLLEAAALGARFSEPGLPLDEGDAPIPNDDADLDLVQFPTVSRLRDHLQEDHVDADFEEALENLLERLDLELSQ